ncbi:YdcF family protein [Thermocrinis minervae]|uniref:Uncharacterized SAM-binding protein YcdF, DUF218 family n=1 Tax=Thermocrinis minervae TaxID=381751 RepID=A0A1M6QR94_9AQUI|nr:YdcF family protein [Thermocrinis minervae]SHK22726.1 Uncharacterized SAM-binding protein YcdF, DUF218 family [Thermocrinis minervae]
MIFLVKKLLSFWMFPPGVFILLLLFLSYRLRKDRLSYFLSISLALSLYLLSTEPVKDLLLTPLERSYPVPEKVEADAIVVLGGGSYSTGILKEDSMKRVLAAFVLHKRTNLPLILSGGSAVGNLPEADIMKSFLVELGIDKRKIITDVQSRDTEQNAKMIKEICEKMGYKKVVLVTSAYHMKRAVKEFQREGLEVVPYPTDFKRDLKYNFFSFMPKMGVLYDSYKAIREYVALLFYDLSLP